MQSGENLCVLAATFVAPLSIFAQFGSDKAHSTVAAHGPRAYTVRGNSILIGSDSSRVSGNGAGVPPGVHKLLAAGFFRSILDNRLRNLSHRPAAPF